jgi:hypothetical protein
MINPATQSVMLLFRHWINNLTLSVWYLSGYSIRDP